MRANELLSMWMERTEGAQCCALLGQGIACADTDGDLAYWIAAVVAVLIFLNLLGLLWVVARRARKASTLRCAARQPLRRAAIEL